MGGRQPPHPPHLLLEIPPVAVTTAPAPVDAAETVELPVAPAEVRALSAVQRRLGAGPVVATARGMSHFGEHAGGWLPPGPPRGLRGPGPRPARVAAPPRGAPGPRAASP